MKAPGRMIVVEGLEGAGKSTAIKTIEQTLQAKVPHWIRTREPGGTALGEAVRQIVKGDNSAEPIDARAELLLFYAARVQLLQQVILPALARGAWVLADRFELSTFAYQGGGRHIDEGMIQHLSQFCVADFKPDLILFLDINPQKGLQRARQRGQYDRIEQEALPFFADVYQSYHRHIRMLNNVVIIDAEQPLPVVQRRIAAALEAFMATDAHPSLGQDNEVAER